MDAQTKTRHKSGQGLGACTQTHSPSHAGQRPPGRTAAGRGAGGLTRRDHEEVCVLLDVHFASPSQQETRHRVLAPRGGQAGQVLPTPVPQAPRRTRPGAVWACVRRAQRPAATRPAKKMIHTVAAARNESQAAAGRQRGPMQMIWWVGAEAGRAVQHLVADDADKRIARAAGSHFPRSSWCCERLAATQGTWTGRCREPSGLVSPER